MESASTSSVELASPPPSMKVRSLKRKYSELDDSDKTSDMVTQLWQDRCDGVFTDVQLLCGLTKESVSVHASILCAASIVFRELIFTDKQQPKVRNRLVLPDVTVEQLLPFLEYLYKKTLTQFETTASMIHGIYAADKYKIPELAELLAARLEEKMKNFTDEEDGALPTAVTIVEMVQVNWLPENEKKFLLPKACQVVIFRLDKLLKEGRLTYDILLTTLSAQNLEYRPSEEDIFKIVNFWSEECCVAKELEQTGSNKRDTIGKIVNNIYFTNIPEKVMLCEVINSKLLKPEEFCAIFQRRNTSTSDIEIPFQDGIRSGQCLPTEDQDDRMLTVLIGKTKLPRVDDDIIKNARDDPVAQLALIKPYLHMKRINDDKRYAIPKEWFTRWCNWRTERIKNEKVERPDPMNTRNLTQSSECTPLPLEACLMFTAWFGINENTLELPGNVIQVGGQPPCEVIEIEKFKFCVNEVVLYQFINTSRKFRISKVQFAKVLSFSRQLSLHDVENSIRKMLLVHPCIKTRMWVSVPLLNDYYWLANTDCKLWNTLDCIKCTCVKGEEHSGPLVYGNNFKIAIELQKEDNTWPMSEVHMYHGHNSHFLSNRPS